MFSLTCAFLPSRQVLDRSTIMRHLHKAEKPDDPFSRTPLTPDMLQPNDELREAIALWLRSRRHHSKTQGLE